MVIKYEIYRTKPGNDGALKPLWENCYASPEYYEKIYAGSVMASGDADGWVNKHDLLKRLYRAVNMPGMREKCGMVVSDIVVLYPRTEKEAAYYCEALNFRVLDNFHLPALPETFTLYGYDKDNDVMVPMAQSQDFDYICMLGMAAIHYQMTSQEQLCRKDNEPFDWFEVDGDGDSKSVLFTQDEPEGELH